MNDNFNCNDINYSAENTDNNTNLTSCNAGILYFFSKISSLAFITNIQQTNIKLKRKAG